MYGERANEIAFSVKKIVKYGRVRIAGTADIFNLLNSIDVLDINRYGPLWLQPATILTGRWVKFGARVDF